MTEFISQTSEDQSAEAGDVCIGCRYSERSIMQGIALAFRKGPRYKKEGCPGKFVGLVKQYDVLRLPEVGVVEACPDRETWDEVQSHYPGFPKVSVQIHDNDFTVGMDWVEVAFGQHINKAKEEQ